jgi:hypothetical protein
MLKTPICIFKKIQIIQEEQKRWMTCQEITIRLTYDFSNKMEDKVQGIIASKC